MPVVNVKNIVKRYGSVLALDHFSLQIEPGEVFGLLGPNGSGKTTAINCMLQLLSYDKGEIELFGEAMSPSRYDLKRRIGVVPQEVAVFDELSVRENIDYFCGLYVSDKRERARLVDEAVEFVGLQDYVKFRPKKLSGGLKRRLNIACGIAHRPELIFFDEPTVAVDPQSRNSILEGILRLNAEGATVVYTSHYMEEVEKICSRIMIMDRGESLATGSKEELVRMVSSGEKMEIETPDLTPVALDAISGLSFARRADYDGTTLRVLCDNGPHNLSGILAILQERGVSFGRVYSEPPTLNDVFLEITGKELRD